MLLVTAHVEIKEDTTKEFLVAANKCIEATRQEKGSVFYALYTNTENALKYVFVEEWESKSAFDEHMQTPHLANFSEDIKDLLASPLDVKIFEANKIQI